LKRLWSLMGLLLIVPWAKLLTSVGLIDLPGQIHKWGSLLRLVTSTYISRALTRKLSRKR